MNTSRYRPTLPRALILSSDPLLGALLGAAAELGDYEPVFPLGGERAWDTLRAARPSLLLIDCDDPAACDESLLGNAMMIGARAFLVGTERSVAALSAFAERYQLRPVVLPRDADQIPELLAIEGTESIPRPPQSIVP